MVAGLHIGTLLSVCFSSLAFSLPLGLLTSSSNVEQRDALSTGRAHRLRARLELRYLRS